MCLAIPGRVIDLVTETNGQLAVVDVAGARRRINVGLLADGVAVSAGDWILIHMGFALTIVSADDAARALGGLQLLGSDGNDSAGEPALAPEETLAPVAAARQP